jgi:hypothetical protein
MGRPNYVCTTCSEHFTRKYSAKRHNLTIHSNGGGEIVPFLEYLVRRSTGQYHASNPSWYRRRSEKSIHQFGRAMIADSVGDTFRTGSLQRQQQGQYQYQHHQQSFEEQERHHRQEQPLLPSIPPSPAVIQDQPPDVLPDPTDRTFQSQSMNTTDDEEKTTTTLSRETILKIQELKRLMYKYSQYHRNPGAVINCIIYYCSNGDNTLLDEKLEQLRSIDAISKH